MGAILTKMHGYTILHKDDLNESCNFKDKELIMHGYKYFYGGDLNRICICKERTILSSSFVIEWLTYIFKKCLGGLKIFVGASGRKKLPAMAMPAQTPAGRRWPCRAHSRHKRFHTTPFKVLLGLTIWILFVTLVQLTTKTECIQLNPGCISEISTLINQRFRNIGANGEI